MQVGKSECWVRTCCIDMEGLSGGACGAPRDCTLIVGTSESCRNAIRRHAVYYDTTYMKSESLVVQITPVVLFCGCFPG